MQTITTKPPTDEAASAAFQRWKDHNPDWTDRIIAEHVGASTAAVATWRKGNAPSRQFRQALETLIGFRWSEPPGGDYHPKDAPKPERRSRTRRSRRTAQAPAAAPVVARPMPESRVSSGDVLLFARMILGRCLMTGGQLDLSHPDVAHAIASVLEVLDRELATHDADFRRHSAASLFSAILAHPDPAATLKTMRSLSAGNVEAGIWDRLQTALDDTSNVLGTGPVIG